MNLVFGFLFIVIFEYFGRFFLCLLDLFFGFEGKFIFLSGRFYFFNFYGYFFLDWFKFSGI